VKEGIPADAARNGKGATVAPMLLNVNTASPAQPVERVRSMNNMRNVNFVRYVMIAIKTP